ncbi:hypothetical protein [Leifsonia sp. NPDC058230]|uniref:hypothetical protein n=1 Tax=Leifsonia sp. NPDC058230 TaxID=3346391 RepID=UPI0036DF9CD3
MKKSKFILGTATVLLISAGVIAIPSAANAAERATGAINCQGNSFAIKEIHTVSNSKGNVTHQIYGSIGHSTPFDHTNSVTAGYSATYASWNTHHVWEFKAKGGKVFATGVTSARVQCE